MKTKKQILILLAAVLISCFLLCSCAKANGYKKKDLVPVNETPGVNSIRVFVVDYNEGKDITVKINNLSGDTFTFGEYYSIQVFADGAWYYVPTVSDNAVHDLAHVLEPGAGISMTYSLSPYCGKLYPGHYRIACCDGGNRQNIYYAEFNVMADGQYKWETVEPTGK